VSDIPGGPMNTRPVHFFWLLDCSSSMSYNGKMGALNYAVREAVPHMQDAARDNATASLLVRVVTFSTGAEWHTADPVPVHEFGWQDVEPSGGTDLGAALSLVARELETPPMPERAMRPVLALVSDGMPTDNWHAGMRALEATPWGRRAVRVAVAIGDDADRSVLKEFLVNPELEPILAKSPKQLAQAIRWASTLAVKAASTPMAGGSGTAATTKLPPPVLTAQEPDVW